MLLGPQTSTMGKITVITTIMAPVSTLQTATRVVVYVTSTTPRTVKGLATKPQTVGTVYRTQQPWILSPVTTPKESGSRLRWKPFCLVSCGGIRRFGKAGCGERVGSWFWSLLKSLSLLLRLWMYGLARRGSSISTTPNHDLLPYQMWLWICPSLKPFSFQGFAYDTKCNMAFKNLLLPI